MWDYFVETDVEATKVDCVSIHLPTGAHLDLMIYYEDMPQYCMDCHRINHKQDACKKKIDGDTAPQGVVRPHTGVSRSTWHLCQSKKRQRSKASTQRAAINRAESTQGKATTVGDQALMLVEAPMPIVVRMHSTPPYLNVKQPMQDDATKPRQHLEQCNSNPTWQ